MVLDEPLSEITHTATAHSQQGTSVILDKGQSGTIK